MVPGGLAVWSTEADLPERPMLGTAVVTATLAIAARAARGGEGAEDRALGARHEFSQMGALILNR